MVASMVQAAAFDTSVASDPLIVAVTRIAGIVILVVMIWRFTHIYADKNKRGEFLGEVIAGVVCLAFVIFPTQLITVFIWLAQQAIGLLPHG